MSIGSACFGDSTGHDIGLERKPESQRPQSYGVDKLLSAAADIQSTRDVKIYSNSVQPQYKMLYN